MQEEYIKFKKLLEYFVSHLEWIQNKQSTFVGYDKYIKPYVDNGSFKMTGQGYDGAGIQNQIKGWESYSCGKICINVQGNYGSYKSVKCYLNWDGTGLNVLARWKNNQITGLYQDEFIYWEEPTRRVNSGKEYSLEKLKLFEDDEISEELIDFYTTFKQRFETFQKNEKIEKLMSSIYKNRDLLKYKKQIILQGPPGTGKTREAKLIAQEMIVLTSDIIKNKLVVGSKIANASGAKEYYSIKAINDDSVTLISDRTTQDWNPTFKEIIEKYNQLTKGIDPSNKNGMDPYSLAVAKHLNEFKFEELFEEQFKLIQFHPSYTYEDFVRGIIAKPNPEGEGVIYEPENKTLGIFCKIALDNYLDSNKDAESISKEVKIKENFENFVEFINDEIEIANGFYALTDNVGLISTDDEFAFRYKGVKEGWLKNGNRILYKDILQSFMTGDSSRKDIKKNTKISGLARQHASYFVRVLNLFQKFIENENLENVGEKEIEKTTLKNFVLIIDEINRANLSSVLGELIYALEYRGEAVDSMYAVNNDTKLILPPNLYIIGTMNTADRSVGHIDYAIRRRFAFVDVLPKNLKEKQGLHNFNETLFLAVEKLFEEHTSPEFEVHDVQLGHSYFIDKSDEENGAGMDIRFEYEIKPILLEYVKDGVLIGTDIKNKIEDLKAHI
ncbi:AAA family ATPase [Flavobacterium sp.]|uniref:AAA family ATPase n=1 Tax=Flavobacterium sp. TaxID=239 RepID=UPI0038FCA075